MINVGDTVEILNFTAGIPSEKIMGIIKKAKDGKYKVEDVTDANPPGQWVWLEDIGFIFEAKDLKVVND